MSGCTWTGTWEDALEQADPALLAECMGLIETLGLLGSWSDLAHWGPDDGGLKGRERPRYCDPETCKVMLACAIMLEINSMSSKPIHSIRRVFELQLERIYHLSHEVNSPIAVFISVQRHLRLHWTDVEHVPNIEFYSPGNRKGCVWKMLLSTGYSVEGWKLYDLPKETAVVTVTMGGSVMLVERGDRVHRYYISDRFRWGVEEVKHIAAEYARRYGYMLYDIVVDESYLRTTIDRSHVCDPTGMWLDPKKVSP
jgi:hypothetical protein